ncbi:GNAT family N-acetyltransferase [Litorihabitans aurantiacus]|uniref:GNAT family acetyltransferase n=1 Tax=Litorihabitans aurantiacus TaxID=1930061 RepID=A0AA37XG00_9MICO|nr:GNAT family N-acetyltransferase [Litorihabitans aurantiacus]GMA32582.1 GNAT family acetyltransferase [Litorihabitans aurantiacus]
MPLSWTHLTDADTPDWADLTAVLAEHDGTDEIYSAQDLAEELLEHGFDPALDSWAVREDGVLVAYGQLRVSSALTSEGWARANVDGGVHPHWRGRGIGTQLLERMEPRARALAAERHPGAPVQLRASGGREGSDARDLLADHGYAPVRYFTDMARSLPGEALGPLDARVRVLTEEMSEAVRLAHNEAFASHWGSTAQSPERWADHIGASASRLADSRVVLDDDGTVLAYALCGQWVDRELYVSLVGTRPEARGRGLARAVLEATVADAAASGRYDLIELGVDTEHPSGAGRLYASVGFAPVRTIAVYAKVEEHAVEEHLGAQPA